MTAMGVAIPHCPVCGEIIKLSVSFSDGAVIVVRCNVCGYTAPGMAVVGMIELPVDPKGDAAYWRSRAEKAEAELEWAKSSMIAFRTVITKLTAILPPEKIIITDTNGQYCPICNGQDQDGDGVIHKSDCPLEGR